MLTQDQVTVLLIALAVNALVVVSLIVAPRIRAWTGGRASGDSLAHVAPTDDELRDPGFDAGQPWFVARSTNGTSGGAGNGVYDHGDADHASEPPTVPLPPLASPSVWAAWLDEEAARAARYQRPVTIVLVELAGLDRLADRVGRVAADRLIPPVASTIRRHARAADRLARLSPTRFGVLLVETDEIRAINYIERVRSACDVWLASGAVALRLSVGWAEIRPDRSVELAVHEAEQRLFDDRRRSEPSEPEPASDGHDGLAGVLQPSAG
jgi:diguanylate cyclase (GGDEF)-like protein